MNGIGAVSTVRDLALLLSVVLGGFLCWSAYHKLVRPRAFIVAASAYRPLSPRVAQWVGLAVPICEFTLGAALVLGVAVRVAALTSGLLFALFAVAMGYNLARGNIIPCGCYGTTRTQTIGIVPIAEDAVLVALAAGSHLPWPPPARVRGARAYRSASRPEATARAAPHNVTTRTEAAQEV